MNSYDVIVIGGGHAGTEAALTSARAGAKTLLLTHNIETIGQMSCNPAVGGIGKSHLVREIDALGGVMGRAADVAGIQFRVLNASKGPAVRATRAQADRTLYKNAIRQFVESQPNLAIFQQAVDDVVLEKHRITGVVTQSGMIFKAKAVILTSGTFLGGQIRLGTVKQSAGRAGDPPAIKLAEKLREILPRVGRLKTGTPPRIDGKTLNYEVMQIQPGDTPLPQFSYLMPQSRARQVPCHITYTTEQTHEIIRDNLHLSPMYSEQGGIDSIGPRYCPSIEDKIVRFADKTSHQIFIEPEGLNTFEIYPNGISTSLPYEVQLAFVRSMVGFQNAHITRPGYAIEYDYFDPRDLRPWLETKTISGLFFAGQINGTTGYEEAAAQGLLAGLNAARQVAGKDHWWPKRDQGYLGVLVDDLTTHGTQEPYRMFTSRAEYRLSLREDNADLRLTEIGRDFGLVDDTRWQVFEKKRHAITKEQAKLSQWVIHPNTEAALNIAQTGTLLTKETHVIDLLKRPNFAWQVLEGLLFDESTPKDAREQVVIQARYEGYLKRQATDIAKLSQQEHVLLPIQLNYHAISGLSAELSEKLSSVKPTTFGQASRIPGMTPAALSLLWVHLKKTGQFKAKHIESVV